MRPTLASQRLLIVCAMTFAAIVAAACTSEADAPEVVPTATATAAATATSGPAGSDPDDESPDAPVEGVLRIAQARDPTSCDLPMSQATSYQSVHPCNPMLSQIVRGSAKDHAVIEPDLAISWETSDDGSEWTFTVRPDASWHSGRTVTSDDLKFSLDRIIDPPPS